jgi:peroxiredoxin Q/BCP
MNYRYKRFFRIALVIGALNSAPLVCTGYSQEHSHRATAPNCGVRSVFNLARHIGKAPNQVQEDDLCKAYPNEQVSMLDVQNAAKRLGIELEGMKATLQEMEARGEPFIAVLPNHFTFVERVEGKWVRYAEDGGLLVRPRELFEKEYQGKSLALAPGAAVNSLKISPAVVEWEKAPTGVLQKTAEITLSNTGNKPIHIENINTSCSCTVPSGGPKVIAPGQKVPLTVTVKVPEWGTFMQSVTVQSDAVYSRQSVTLMGSVESDVVLAPQQLQYGDIVVGKKAVKSVVLRDLDRKLPRPLRVSTASALATAKLITQDENNWSVEVTLDAPTLPAFIDTELLISGAGANSRVLHVPIKARAVPMTRTRPEQVVFGSVTSEVATRTFQLYRQDGRPFEVTGVKAPGYLKCETEPVTQRRNEWRVKVQITSALAPAQVTDSLVFTTTSEGSKEEISVPVLGLIEKAVLPTRTMAEAALLPSAEDEAGTEIGLALPKVKIGQHVPDFTANDSNGNPWRLSALRGNKNVLLTFFPKCFTGGCTTQLVSLRDHQQKFDAAQTQILAISVDEATGDKGQQAYAREWHLGFPLLPDVERRLCLLFGTVQKKNQRAGRMSVLIDKQGIVRHIDTELNVHSHGTDMLAKVHEIGLDR